MARHGAGGGGGTAGPAGPKGVDSGPCLPASLPTSLPSEGRTTTDTAPPAAAWHFWSTRDGCSDASAARRPEGETRYRV